MRLLRSVGLLLAALLILVAPALSAGPASAAAPGQRVSIVLIGDSYSAGNGAGSYERGAEGASYRSTINWARNYTSWLNGQGMHTTFTNLAYSGSVTSDLLKPGGQIDQIPANADVVMLTIGGNDAKFSEVVEKCFAQGARSPRGCEEKVRYADAEIGNIQMQTERIFQKLSEKLAPGAQVVLVSYPLLSTTRQYELTQCYSSSLSICSDWVTYDAGSEVRKLGNEAAESQRSLVDRWNASSGLKVTYVDSVPQAFAGHEPDPSASSKNDYRWVNEFIETEGRLQPDGKTKGKGSWDKLNWYHPNVIGHQKIAVEVQRTVGVPFVSHPITVSGGDIDIVFVIDATGSMSGAIDSVKRDVREIVDQIKRRSDTYRFALVTYKDHPEVSGDPWDYPSQLELGFTTDVAAFEAALASIYVDGGGDWQEAVYSGVMEGLQLDWRPGVKKIAIVLGDAPPKDPEPITGYTAQSVAKYAFDIDPVEVYAVDNGDMVSDSMQALIDLSAGEAYRALEDGDVADLVTEAIVTALDKPFAWLQGPIAGYAGQTVEFDARGSYAYDGAIQTYEWDFDGDGEYDQVTENGLVEHTYDVEFEGVAGVKVTAADGQFAVGSAPVFIINEPEDQPEPAPVPDQEGVYEVLDGDPLPFEVAADSEAALTLSKTEVEQGGSLDVSGANLPPNTTLEITLQSDPVELARVTTDDAGAFTRAVVIPEDAVPGAHKVVVKYGELEISADLTVLEADKGGLVPPVPDEAQSSDPQKPPSANPDRGSGLSKTGANGTVAMLVSGAFLVLIGGTLFVVRNKRAHKQ